MPGGNESNHIKNFDLNFTLQKLKDSSCSQGWTTYFEVSGRLFRSVRALHKPIFLGKIMKKKKKSNASTNQSELTNSVGADKLYT